MRILLIGNFAPDRQESMQRFARLLATGLRDAGHEVATWSPEPRLVRLLPHYRYGGASKYIGYVDKFLLFPHRLRERIEHEGRPDVVHILDHANSIYAPLFHGLPLVTTCHDLMQIRAARGEFPQNRVSALGRRYQNWILRHLADVPHIVTPSSQTAADLRRLGGVPPQRITVIPLGLNYPYRRQSAASARLLIGRMLLEHQLAPGLLEHSGRGFVVNVGGGQWYKNRLGLLDIYAGLRQRLDPPPRLVMIGKPLTPAVVAHARRLGVIDDVINISNVSEPHLEAVYSLAEALIFPSWVEGYGWPVAEAQACGCPVITSDRPPMTEVSGGVACFIDPGNSGEAVERVMEFWPRRTEFSTRGLARAGQFSARLMIERYLSTYQKITASRSNEAIVA